MEKRVILACEMFGIGQIIVYEFSSFLHRQRQARTPEIDGSSGIHAVTHPHEEGV